MTCKNGIGTRIPLLAAWAFLATSSVAIAEDPTIPLQAGARVRVHAGQAREIPGVLTLRPYSVVVTTNKIVANDDRLVAVKVPGRDAPVCLPRPGATLTGRLLATGTESWTIAVDGHKTPFQVPRNVVEALEVSRGRSGRGRRVAKGAGVGLLVGTLAGGLVGVVSANSCSPQDWLCSPEVNAAGYGALLGVLGAAAGAVAGGTSERWERVAPGRIRVSLGPVRGRGARLYVALAF